MAVFKLAKTLEAETCRDALTNVLEYTFCKSHFDKLNVRLSANRCYSNIR